MNMLKTIDITAVVTHMTTLEVALPGSDRDTIAALVFALVDRALAGDVTMEELITNLQTVFASRAKAAQETRTGLN